MSLPKRYLIKLLHLIRKIIHFFIYNALLKKKDFYPYGNDKGYIFRKYYYEEIDKSYNHFKKYFNNAVFLEFPQIRLHAIKKAIENDKNLNKFYLEFGVHTGKSINVFSKFLKKIYGFDSFQGLREDMPGHTVPAGYFNRNKLEPKVNKNVVLLKGWVQDTLEEFLKKNKPEINFVHMDIDTYPSTKFVLSKIKPFLQKNCIIIFDDFYNFTGWEVGEYKAFKETFNEEEYKFLAFSANGEQAVVQIK